MGKFIEVEDGIEKMFNKVVDKTTIPEWVEFKIMANNKQKELIKPVKFNDLVEGLTKINIVVVINEEIFEKLPKDLQEIAFEECIAGVNISGGDAVSLVKGDFVTHTGILAKYGHALIIQLKESVKSLYDKKEDDEKKVKDAAKANKKKKF